MYTFVEMSASGVQQDTISPHSIPFVGAFPRRFETQDISETQVGKRDGSHRW